MGLRSSSKKDDIPQTPAKDRSHTEQHPGMSADKPPGSSGMNNCPSQPDSAFIVDELTQPQLQEKPIESPSDKPIRQLWDVAYENLRAEHAQLVQSFENQIKGNLGAGIIIGPTTKKDWMNAILKRKMDQIKRDHPTLKLGGSEVEVQDVVKPVLSVFNWVNDFVSTAVSANPYAAIAWSGVSLLLPLLLNPLEQRKSLAQGLEYISSLIVRSYMWEDLHMRRYGSDTSQAASSSHAAYRRTLEMLYREVLRFQIVAYRYYNHNPISRLVRSAVKYDDWIELLESIKNLEVEFHGIMSSLDNNQRQTMGGFDNIAKDLSEMKKKDEKTLGAKQRTKLLEWLCEVDTSTQYIAAREKHQNGTCQWLVNESWKFETWKRAPKSFLWLNGKAGSGKSILSSSVIKHLKDQYEKDPQTALAYFFFSFGNAQQQSASVMISSLLRQLWASRQDTSKEMRNFANLKERGERPDMGALEAALSATIHGFREVFIVVDALDECPTIHSERAEKDIESKMGEILSTPSKVSIDLAEQQLGLNADMELYIDSVLSTEKYRSWPKDVKVDAKNALVEKADGMFQYIVCQFEVLQKLRSKKPILEALKNLPMGLDNTYDRLLQGVDLDFQSQVLGSLKWLALSNGGRLRLSELAEIFALCSEPAATFDKDQRLFDPKDVLEYFPSIVATETGSEQKDPRSFMSEYETVTFVRLAHFTVKEYLMSDRIQDGPAKQFYFTEENAHLKIAHDCLSYHLYRSAEDRKDDNDLPLKRYAVENWEWHLELVPRNLWTPEIVWLASSALFTRKGNGFLVQEDLDLALLDAVDGGNAELVQFLLKEGADVNARSEVFTGALGERLGGALQVATYNIHLAIVELLLDHGADINARYEQQSPLEVAAGRDSLAALELLLLLDNGVDINDRKGRRHGTALQAALELSRGHSKVVSRVGFLLEHGADVNVGAGLYGFPLQSACMAPEGIKGIGGIMWDENVDGLVYLLENCSDIDVNMKGGIFCTALQAAVYNGKTSAPDCQQPLEPDQKWLELVAEEDGRGAVERYETFCKKLKVKLNDEDELKDGKIG
ncbi:hypothetical protein KHU50_004149 [Colletotrichum sp. SAR 10_65]|nr:hypothetical protein KHU50_004149 [Colletotrichum sp. SAR 10_65]